MKRLISSSSYSTAFYASLLTISMMIPSVMGSGGGGICCQEEVSFPCDPCDTDCSYTPTAEWYGCRTHLEDCQYNGVQAYGVNPSIITSCMDEAACCIPATEPTFFETGEVPGMFVFDGYTIAGMTYETWCASLGEPNVWCGIPDDHCQNDPSCFGDPHFKTWGGQWYDYHGECDLILLSVANFGLGLGLVIHVRTTLRYDYSYIESAAIQIGDDILEVSGFGSYLFNGISNVDFPLSFADGQYTILHNNDGDDDEATKNISTPPKAVFDIVLGDTEHIVVSSFKDMVGIKIVNGTKTSFDGAVGLMGTFPDGHMIGRNGTTTTATLFDDDNLNDFGQEWQVMPGQDPNLFQAVRAPQYPAKCLLPTVKDTHRRLGESTISQEDAKEACSHGQWEGADDEDMIMEMCIADVIATGDLEMAHAGVF